MYAMIKFVGREKQSGFARTLTPPAIEFGQLENLDTDFTDYHGFNPTYEVETAHPNELQWSGWRKFLSGCETTRPACYQRT